MTVLLEPKFESLPHRHLIVCEGFNDARFIAELLEHIGLENCSVGCPSTKGGHGEGIEAIPLFLDSVRGVIQRGAGDLSGLVVIADADEDPDKCFANLCNALEGAKFVCPSKPFSIEGEPLKVGVFVMPGEGRTGTLEHLIWDAAKTANPLIESCVETFLACAGDHHKQANENNTAKMKVSSLVAASCYSNPSASLGLMWKQKNNPVPIDSPHFEPLADFLRAFVANVPEAISE